MSRRRTVFRLVRGTAFLSATAASVVAWWSLKIAPRRPQLERITLQLPPHHPELDGVRIGFITDTHIGPTFRPADLQPAVSLLADEAPDLVLMGGDFASESPRYAGQAAASLAPLADASRLGALAVLGNHDMECGAEKVVSAFAAVNIRVLRNEAVRVEIQGGALWIAGIDEVTHFNHAASTAFLQIPPGAAVLALWHEPDFAEQPAELGAFAQLSGHTHGGQIRFPFVGPLVLPRFGRRFIMGLYRVGSMQLYVSRGAGVYRPPVRLRCPPEVTLVTLRATQTN